MKTYPIIIFPKKLIEISTSLPALPKEPAKPKEPILNTPERPIKPKEPQTMSQAYGAAILFIVVFILLFLFLKLASEKGNPPFIFIVIFLILPFGAIGSIRSYHQKNKTNKDAHDIHLKKYFEDLKNYNLKVKNYALDLNNIEETYNEVLLPKYFRELKEFEHQKNQVLSEEKVMEFRRGLRNNFFNSVSPPMVIDKDYSSGVSETPFMEFLITKSLYFSVFHTIKTDLKNYYIPDITFFREKYNIYIDIEIDEPYIGVSGTPIHYLGADDTRNNFFINNGWIVIRFAEIQVVKYPENCYNVIRSVLNGIVNCNFTYDSISLPQVECWSKNEAHQMAFNRYRNKYLNKEFVEKLQNEFNRII